MNLEPGGKNAKHLRDTHVIDSNHPEGGFVQSMVLPDGRPKGLKIVLTERGLWPQDGRKFLAQCSVMSSTGKSTKPNPRCLDGGGCCARTVLAAQPDFQSQRSQIEQAILNTGYEVIFYAAFHCEINFIEYYWGAAKHYTCENCEYDFESLKHLIPKALAGVPKQQIWRYWAKAQRIMDAYRSKVVYGSKEYENLVTRKYRSHRRVTG